MMMPKPAVQTTPGSVLSLRPTAPGSPVTITAKVDGGVIGYKDLAALPRDKAILEIERPDLMLYQPHYCYSPIESSLSPYSVSPPPSPEHTLKDTRDWLDRRSGGGSSPGSTNQSRTHSSMSTPTTTPQTTPTPTQTSAKLLPQHFHRPENGSNIYKKPPIYKQAPSAAPQGKHIEDLIIESSKFPSAQAPDPNQPSMQGNLGKILLKEDKTSAPLRRKKTRSLPERSTGSKSSKLASSQTSGLSRGTGTQDTTQTDHHAWTQTVPQWDDKSSLCPWNGESQMDRGASLPPCSSSRFSPYSSLVVTHRGRSTLPPEVDRTQLERHLSEDEFYSVFRMTLDDFDKLSLWKRNELKKKVCLF
ncbi:hypothetical protein WMY93_004520 [Mugilogobius chulae]|uniref:HP domain-containing protein n=1 Tax=Mugilogobius chulae TaxID=88201 RepID=A0AAW0PP76_9GOBI